LDVGDDADVPEERTFGVRHEIARVGEIRVADLLLRQPIRRRLAADQHAAVENIQPNRRHALRALIVITPPPIEEVPSQANST
jgi:hypothetical protein